jgi:hypothetical protein
MIEIKESSTYSSSPLKLDKSLSNFNCSCSLSEQDSIKGLLYIKKNCIAFISEDQSEEQTIQINFKEINQINYNEEDIEIDMKNENKINLCAFDEINSAIDKIKFTYELFKENDNKDDKNISFSDSDSNFDNDENNKTSLSSKVSLNSSISNDASTKNIFSIEEDKDKKPLKENQSTNNIKKLVLNEEKDENKSFIRNNSSNNFTINKKIELFEPKEDKPIIPEKIKFTEINSDLDYEVCKKIINIPPKEFFEKYQTNKNHETSYHAYYDWVGEYSEISVPEWEKIDNKKNSDIQKYQRNEKFCLALHGVPLINKSNVEKICTYWIDKEGTYYLHSLSKSNGVPLSDKFTVETMTEFHPYMNNTKTVLRTYVRTNIIKWTIFKLALISQGKKTYSQEIEKWFKFISEKGDKIEGDYCI